jgi:hypothetical protein
METDLTPALAARVAFCTRAGRKTRRMPTLQGAEDAAEGSLHKQPGAVLTPMWRPFTQQHRSQDSRF